MITAVLVLLGLAAGAFAVRLVRGPSLADRVVALDGMLTVIVMIIAAYGVQSGSTEFVVVTVVVALVAFVGTATFARFIERRGT